MASCRGCSDPIVHYFNNIYDCGNFGCFGTSNGEAVRNAVKYNVKADITDSKGQLTDIEVAGPRGCCRLVRAGRQDQGENSRVVPSQLCELHPGGGAAPEEPGEAT